MDKKGIYSILMGLVKGGLSLGLVVAVIEMALKGPRDRLRKKGLFGIFIAMILSFLVPYIAKLIYRAVARPGKA
jgi:hypothetical protein